MNSQKFSIRQRLLSFSFAFNGLKIIVNKEHNFRIHILASIFTIAAGLIFKISSIEWVIIVFTIGLVFISEIFNSAIERIADFICPDKNEKIKVIKDISATAVLISALAAFIIGLIIFIPKIIGLFY